MMNSSFQLEDPAASLALQQALAFVDACDIGSDEDMGEGDLDALLADVPTDHLFAPDELLMPMPDALKSQPHVLQQQLPVPMQLPPMGEFTGLMIGAESEPDTSLEGALAVLTTHCDASASDGSSSSDEAGKPQADSIASATAAAAHQARTSKKAKRPRAPSPTRTAKDFAAANAAMAAANGIPQSSKPVKKRVRRQREELLYLRVKVKEMESSLAELKSKETRSRTPPGSSTELACNGKPNSEGASLLASVWESLANRQYKDRERAEQDNRKLTSTLEGQIKLAKCLEQILEDQPDGDVGVGVAILCCKDSVTDDSLCALLAIRCYRAPSRSCSPCLSTATRGPSTRSSCRNSTLPFTTWTSSTIRSSTRRSRRRRWK